ncbi:hypothetical protein NPIL_606741 [Nephila pilipes]|uniref:Uncharacterized protein n=1 Tax=Nephila pilipes TaxID=299642 RepID=A0A8X6QI09_NEPPI|nr:hypothetical protein NPIL_702371 [Nephila pilipes]GFU19823.1 hypothetical protein NPIL_606741 [Nephila pilipes]
MSSSTSLRISRIFLNLILLEVDIAITWSINWNILGYREYRLLKGCLLLEEKVDRSMTKQEEKKVSMYGKLGPGVEGNHFARVTILVIPEGVFA